MKVLITGAAGTLGRAFARYLTKDHVLTLVDSNEWGCACLEKDFPEQIVRLEDFCQSTWSADFIIHCAAYKHVDLGEHNINTFLDNNISKVSKLMGIYHHKGLFISTDKAVEPCNLYGYTKAIGEKLASANGWFVARLPNILGSNGSVLPIWEKEIAEGKPLTITDPTMIRYVCDVDEAVAEIWGRIDHVNGPNKVIIPKHRRYTVEIMYREVLKKAGKPDNYPVKIVGARPGEKHEEKMVWDGEAVL